MFEDLESQADIRDPFSGADVQASVPATTVKPKKDEEIVGTTQTLQAQIAELQAANLRLAQAATPAVPAVPVAVAVDPVSAPAAVDSQEMLRLLQALQAQNAQAAGPTAAPVQQPPKSSRLPGVLGCLVVVVLLLLLTSAVAALAIQLGYGAGGGLKWLENSRKLSAVTAAVQEYNAQDDFIVGQTYLEAADLVRKGELKSLKEFEEWKAAQEQSSDGQVEGPRQDNYAKNFQPALDTVNEAAGEVDVDQLADVLEAIGRGWLE